jgi:hypothetical protein
VGITTDPEKPKAVREWPTVKNKHEIRSFLGLRTYFRQFISDFANIAKPLTRRTEGKQAFKWTPAREAAFQALREAPCTAPILVYPKPRERFLVNRLEECYHRYRTDRSELYLITVRR